MVYRRGGGRARRPHNIIYNNNIFCNIGRNAFSLDAFAFVYSSLRDTHPTYELLCKHEPTYYHRQVHRVFSATYAWTDELGVCSRAFGAEVYYTITSTCIRVCNVFPLHVDKTQSADIVIV